MCQPFAESAVGVFQDISERKALEQQKDEFISIASHELKTPVTSIKAYAELLLEKFTRSQQPESASIMQKLNAQIDRLNYLVRDLLDTTKIADDHLQLHIERFNLNELIAARVEELQRLSEKHELVFRQSSIRPITADRERIGQVLINLITNAIKYSPNGGKVTVSTEQEKGGVKISVNDQGIGIAEEVRHKVFDRFYRVSNPKMETFPGMGLGLYISAGIIKRHGGTIAVDSEPGKGSTFYFTLPYNGATNA